MLEQFEVYITKYSKLYGYHQETIEKIKDNRDTVISAYGDFTSKIKPIDIIKALEKENIESRHIWKPIHLQPYYKEFNFFSHNDVGISVCEDIFERGICLPSDTKMTIEDQQRVIDVIKGLFK